MNIIKKNKEISLKIRLLSEEEKEKSEKRPVKGIKIFLQKRKKRKRQYYNECNKNLSEYQKQRLVEYRRNYYIT